MQHEGILREEELMPVIGLKALYYSIVEIIGVYGMDTDFQVKVPVKLIIDSVGGIRWHSSSISN